jgi:Ras-related GTP-binding protein C/D
MDNSYLFDIKSGVVLATDNRHRNNSTMEQITEYLARFLQFREIYRSLKGVSKPDDKLVSKEPADEVAEEVWWGEEDIEAPWMTQNTRLMPNCTLALWQFTP